MELIAMIKAAEQAVTVISNLPGLLQKFWSTIQSHQQNQARKQLVADIQSLLGQWFNANFVKVEVKLALQSYIEKNSGWPQVVSGAQQASAELQETIDTLRAKCTSLFTAGLFREANDLIAVLATQRKLYADMAELAAPTSPEAMEELKRFSAQLNLLFAQVSNIQNAIAPSGAKPTT